jgi:hypothetical protein
MQEIRIAVACLNASGIAEIPVFTVCATPEEIASGMHYEKAQARAEQDGYQSPFVFFDAGEQRAILAAARHLDMVPELVTVEMDDGQVQAVHCDAGIVNVICYEIKNFNKHADRASGSPFLVEGQPIQLKAHVRIADVDPGIRSLLIPN